MEVVKRNLYSIICGVIAIVAVVLVFYPLGGMFEALQGKLDESKSDYNSINSLLSKDHTAPDVDIYNAEQRKLGRFPTPKVIAAGEAAVTKVQEQSLALLQTALTMNRKEPLVPAALPVQQTGAALSDFKIFYYRKFAEFKEKMKATTAPTQDDVTKRLDALRAEMELNAGVGGDLARSSFDVELTIKELTVPDEMGRERAARGQVYVSAEPAVSSGGTFGGETPELMGLRSFDVHHPGIPTPSQLASPSLVDIWAAQLGLWVQEDVVDAIAKTNGNAAGVPDAVVKRLIEIKVPKEYITKQGRVVLVDASGVAMRPDQMQQQQSAEEGADAGAAILDSNQPPKDGRQSATGRICNPLYDVIHFTITLDADATRFQEFMASLVSNRHITILSVDLEGVDRDREFQALYVYGDNPVVRMRLTCEALMFREWSLPLMPDAVKKFLDIQPPVEGMGADPLVVR